MIWADTKTKEGHTHPASKDEHTVDLATGAIVVVTVQSANTGDSLSLPATLEQTQPSLVDMREPQVRPRSVDDKSNHRDETLKYCDEKNIWTYVSEPRRLRKWKGQAQKKRARANHRGVNGKRGEALWRRRAEPGREALALQLRREAAEAALKKSRQDLLAAA